MAYRFQISEDAGHWTLSLQRDGETIATGKSCFGVARTAVKHACTLIDISRQDPLSAGERLEYALEWIHPRVTNMTAFIRACSQEYIEIDADSLGPARTA